MNEIIKFTQFYRKSSWIVATIVLIWFGFCSFPLGIKLYTAMLVIPYTYTGIILVGLVEKSAFKVFLFAMTFTIIGMICRYLIEYGEVSNTINFTLMNIIIFLIAIPSLVTISYMFTKLKNTL